MALRVFTSPTSITALQTDTGFVFYISLAPDVEPTTISITSGSVPENTAFSQLNNDTASIAFIYAWDGLPTAGVYPLTISAVNGSGTATHNVTITVTPTVPNIISSGTLSGSRGNPLSYNTLTIPETHVTSIITGLPPGCSYIGGSEQIVGSPTAAGVYNASIQATNPAGTNTKPLTITISASPPVITSVLTASGVQGTPISAYAVTATNVPTSFSASGLPAGLSINTTSGVITGTPSGVGTVNSTISATNVDGTGSATLVWTITSPPAPVITSPLTKSGTQGSAISTYTVTASNSPTSFSASGLPAGLSINTSTGAITGTPSGSGTVNSTISATNGAGTGSATLVWTLTAASPVVTSPLTASGTQGTAFSYAIGATNSPTSYNATGLPAGLSVNTTTGVISGTPSAAGTTNVTILATNGVGTGSATLVLTVAAAVAPTISSPLTASGTYGTPFTYTILAANSPTSFGATGLPAGLTVNSTTGVISGTPAASGTINVTISATNLGGTGSATLVLTITAIVPVITSPPTTTQQQGYPFTYTIVGGNQPTSFGATGLPAGLTLNTSTGVISGIPSGVGTYVVTMTATNAAGTTTSTLTITLLAGIPIPTITSALTATAIVGAAFSYTITTDVVTTSRTASGLPSGLSFNSTTGVISGVPTAVGVNNVTITATNGTGTDTETLVLTRIIAPPIITSPLTTSGSQLSAFTYTVAASNAPTSYGATNLPLGLSINPTTGVIAGTLTGGMGSSTATISATNSAGTTTASLVFTVTVFVPPPPVVTSAASAAVLRDTEFIYTIAGTNNPASFWAIGLPAGLYVNSATGVIRGFPSIAAVTPITVLATNTGGTGTKVLTLTVVAPVAKTVGVNGDMMSQRHVVAGEATVIIKGTSFARQADVVEPLDESGTNPLTVNIPGGTWAGRQPGTVTSSTD